MTTLCELMRPAPPCVEQSESIRVAEAALLRHNADRLLTVEPGGQIAGVVTDTALLRHRLCRQCSEAPISSIASQAIFLAEANLPVDQVLAAMRDGRHSVIVLVANDRAVGCVTRVDVLRHLCAASEQAVSPAARPKFLEPLRASA